MKTKTYLYIIMCAAAATAATGCRRASTTAQHATASAPSATSATTAAADEQLPASAPALRGGGRCGPFVIEVINGYTPVKDQGRSSVCWAYAMLAAIETEHIMRGDSVHLSVKYAVRGLLADIYRRSYLSRGTIAATTRGTGATLLGVMERHGMVGYDAYHDYGTEMSANIDVTARKVERLARKAVRTRAGLETFRPRLDAIIDEAFGTAPRRVYMLGAEYTPGEFARSVCAPGEYVALTSFTHHPFYTSFALEIPDNSEQTLFYNIPADSLMAVMEKAVRRGHGVCWEGDISESGFSFDHGTAVLPPHTDTSQEARQRAFERFETTDDHCMAIVGLARDARGRLFYIMKSSWGTGNAFGGLMFMSADYVRMKTVGCFLSREGL